MLLTPGEAANPCGLIAKSLFNDTFTLMALNSDTESIEIKDSGIAWPSDKEYKYKKP